MGMKITKKPSKAQLEKQRQAAEIEANNAAMSAMAMQLAMLQAQVAAGGKA